MNKLENLGIRFSNVQPQEATNGDFDQQSLSQVLGVLATERKTGVLRIDGESEIWIDEGAIYLALTQSSVAVADVLFGSGVANEQVIADLLAAENANASQALADQYPDSVAILDRLLHEFNLTALFELIVPSALGFRFEPGAHHPVGPRFSEPVSELIAQAERRLEIWTKIAARIPNTTLTFKLSGALPDAVDERVITGDEWRYLAILDGDTSVAGVIGRTGESAFRVCSTLYRLLLEGLIEEA